MRLLLSPENQALVTAMARLVVEKHTAKNTRQRYGHGPRSYEEERNAFGAEAAVCQHHGFPWRGTDEPAYEGDGIPGIQTRWTRHKHGCLPLHPDDIDWHRFFLVTGFFPEYEIVGWVWGDEGKEKGEWGDFPGQEGRPCFKVPQLVTHPPDERMQG